MEKKGSLLIIDDAPESIDILCAMFRERYHIKAATSGLQGIKVIQCNNPPDLVLLDIIMPEIDGFEVCREIKKVKGMESPPIIFITSKTAVKDKVKGFLEGGVDYITKPFEPEEVQARVHTHMELQLARKMIQLYTTELESLLKKRTKELIYSERQAAFGQLVQGIVHNIASPLAGIAGTQQYMQLLINDYHKTTLNPQKEFELLKNLIQETEKSFKLIEQSVNNMDRITQSLLAKSRADKSDEIENTDLNTIIRMEINFLEADMRFKHDIVKHIIISDEKLFTDVIPAEIAQVFQNIVNNALDAMGDKKNRWLEICSGIEKDSVFFSITDNGPGIPTEYQNRIYDPFFTTKIQRETANQKDLPPGTGLGLWMCQETVKSYGGKIHLESVPGGGAKFKVILPKSM